MASRHKVYFIILGILTQLLFFGDVRLRNYNQAIMPLSRKSLRHRSSMT